MRPRHVAILLSLFVVGASSSPEPCESIPIWRGGRVEGAVCRSAAAARGLTVVELDDDWVPPIMTGTSYRATYRALAQERFSDAGRDAELAPRDRYFELFGIEPTLGVIRSRLADPSRHVCHAAIDNTALAAAPVPITDESRSAAVARIAEAAALRVELADLDALRDPAARRSLDRLNTAETYLAAIGAAQAHLACDQVFAFPPIDNAYTWQTSMAIATFQRGAMILPTGVLDEPTRTALLLDSHERDFRAALRVLRARVVAATGLIEDGTAGSGPYTVLDRSLDSEATWRARGQEPLAGAAPDLVSAATEAAARALGWRDAASTLAFLGTGSRAVAIALPPAPTYHSTAMALSIEIDRGDVWHDAAPTARDIARRPAPIVYVTDGARRIPLARWPTTIGGWQDRKAPGGDIDKHWQESPAGHWLWRDIYVGPTWLPPATIPDRELVRTAGDGDVLATEVLGPSYRAAFGLVAFPHFAVQRRDGRVVLEPGDIVTHGSGNLPSIANDASHGCHRLLGMYAVRLADFLLAHRGYLRRGDEPTSYQRNVRDEFAIAIDSLGYRIELTSPIPVEVLPGRIHEP